MCNDPDWDKSMLKEKDTSDPPKAARKLANATGEPVEKFTPSEDVTFPHPTELERVDPSEIE